MKTTKRPSGILRIMMAATAVTMLSSCHVHEWPRGGAEPTRLHLDFASEYRIVEYSAEDTKALDDGWFYYEEHDHGYISYTVRAYPMTGDSYDHEVFLEHTFLRDITEGYNCSVDLPLTAGKYHITVFSQLTEIDDNNFFYDESEFRQIKLSGEYEGSSLYRDTFSGMIDVEIGDNRVVTVPMTRPMAKYEFISTDLAKFLEKEAVRNKSKGGESRSSLEDYNVVFSYVGYVPTAYNLHEDRNVDSKMGVTFQSTPEVLNEEEVSLGFDHIFTGTTETYVTVQVALYERATGLRVSMSEPLRIPLQRDCHTVVRGSFLFGNANSGIGIDSEYDDEYNYYFEM